MVVMNVADGMISVSAGSTDLRTVLDPAQQMGVFIATAGSITLTTLVGESVTITVPACTTLSLRVRQITACPSGTYLLRRGV